MKAKILLVEDEENIREAISEYLLEMGYIVKAAKDGQEGIDLFNENNFDLVILDIMLPKVNGFVVLNKIREASKIPVLMLTAMNDEHTQIMSFDGEADDFIAKPFSVVVLHKRIEALLRRSLKSETIDIWSYEDVEVDFLGYSAKKNGEIVDLKPKEIQLLRLLIKNKGKVLTRDQILDSIWDIESAPNDRVVDVYVKNIRKKLKLECIITVKGIGYKFEDRV